MEKENLAVTDSAINAIKDVLEVQLQSGNWNFDPYMHGMTNGLILALALIEDKEPEFKEAPERWLCDECPSNPFYNKPIIEEMKPIDQEVIAYIECKYFHKKSPFWDGSYIFDKEQNRHVPKIDYKCLECEGKHEK